MGDKRLDLNSIGESIVGAVRIAASLLTPMMRSRRSGWGATGEEVQRSLPGDDLVPNCQWAWTHAITIEAPVAEVWKWLVQIGQGRGGFYSYELLENLIGCDIHNADRIVPEWQDLEVGDLVHLHPQVPGLPVVMLEPERSLVLHAITNLQSGDQAEAAQGQAGSGANLLWMWYLEEQDGGATRLFSRTRYDYEPTLANKLMYGTVFVEPIGFEMDRRMLLGLKQRAEAGVREE